MKYRSPRYDINKPRHKDGYKYAKYKMCISMTMIVCTKQQLSNIRISIHEKVQ